MLFFWILFGREDFLFLSMALIAKPAVLIVRSGHHKDSTLSLLPPWLHIVLVMFVLAKLQFILPRALHLWNPAVGELLFLISSSRHWD
jgi:hypothetical protein